MRLRGDYGSRATLPLNLFFPLHVFAEGPQSFAPVADVYQSSPQCAIGGRSARVPNTTNLYFDYVEGESLVIALDLRGFAVSSGSACSSGSVEPSHVLLAIGLPPERARASIRFSLGRSNTEEQVDALIDAIVDSVAHLRKISPLTPAHA